MAARINERMCGSRPNGENDDLQAPEVGSDFDEPYQARV